MEAILHNIALLRRLDSLFQEMARHSLTPWAWSFAGWETALSSVHAALKPDDWISPDIQAWPMAILRGALIPERLLALPKVPAYETGHVMGIPSQLGARVQQTLGVAFGAKSRGAMVACFLGPTEAERPETADAMQRAASLSLPVLFLYLAADAKQPDFSETSKENFTEQVRALCAQIRASGQPAQLICPKIKLGLELLPEASRQEVMASVRKQVAQTAKQTLGQAQAAWLERFLDERDAH